MRLLALLCCLLLGACARPVPEGVTELTYATPYPPSHPFSQADQRWIEWLEEESQGRIAIRPIWSGALLSSDMSMEELRHGVADIGLITPIYARGGAHLIRVQTGFYIGADSTESQVELYRCLEASVPQIAHELEGLKVLAVQGGSLPGILTLGRPVEQLSDLQAMRIRVPSGLLTVFESLGADPVSLPMGEVYSALAKGVIDGVIAPPDTFQAMHFAEVADFYYELKVARGAYPARAMGVQRWNLLEQWQRDLLERSTPIWEAALAEKIRASERAGREAAQGQITYAQPTAEEQQSFNALYLRDSEANARALSRFGINGLKAFQTARSALVARDRIDCGEVS